MSPIGAGRDRSPGGAYIGSPGGQREPTYTGNTLLERVTTGVLSLLFTRHGDGHGTLPSFAVCLVNLVRWHPKLPGTSCASQYLADEEMAREQVRGYLGTLEVDLLPVAPMDGEQGRTGCWPQIGRASCRERVLRLV